MASKTRNACRRPIGSSGYRVTYYISPLTISSTSAAKSDSQCVQTLFPYRITVDCPNQSRDNGNPRSHRHHARDQDDENPNRKAKDMQNEVTVASKGW